LKETLPWMLHQQTSTQTPYILTHYNVTTTRRTGEMLRRKWQ